MRSESELIVEWREERDDSFNEVSNGIGEYTIEEDIDRGGDERDDCSWEGVCMGNEKIDGNSDHKRQEICDNDGNETLEN